MEAGQAHLPLNQVKLSCYSRSINLKASLRSARASVGTEPCELKLGENVAAFLNNEEVKTGAKIKPGESLVHR